MPSSIRALKYLWASPVIVVGLLAAILFLDCQMRWDRGSLVIRANNRFGRWMTSRGWGGFTLGVTIFLWSDGDPAVEFHERVHVRQVLQWGPLFPIIYLVSLALHGYRGCVFERQARADTAEWLAYRA